MERKASILSNTKNKLFPPPNSSDLPKDTKRQAAFAVMDQLFLEVSVILGEKLLSKLLKGIPTASGVQYLAFQNTF